MPCRAGGGTGGGTVGCGGGKDLDKEMVEVKGLEYPEAKSSRQRWPPVGSGVQARSTDQQLSAEMSPPDRFQARAITQDFGASESC